VADAVPDVDDPSVRVRDVHLLQGGAEKCLQDASASGISAVASKRMAADHRGPSLGYDGRIASNNSRMPWGTAGAGQTLAIMEIGGGFGQGALDTYFSVWASPSRPRRRSAPTTQSTLLATTQGADGGVLLDIEVGARSRPRPATGTIALTTFTQSQGALNFRTCRACTTDGRGQMGRMP
jgi:hypothetical protein